MTWLLEVFDYNDDTLFNKYNNMTLGEFKKHIESFEESKVFNYWISEPFSWRWIYNEVAFSFIPHNMSREEVLKNINMAYTEVHFEYMNEKIILKQ